VASRSHPDTRTEHAIVGEIYDDDPPRAAHAGASRASPPLESTREELIDVVWHLRYDDEYT